MRAALALALLLVLGAWTRPEPFDPFGAAKVQPPVHARAPMDTVLRDQDGRPQTLAARAHGRPLVLAPVQYLCPNLCGLTLTGLAQAASRQPAPAFAVAALGIDPREGPADAAKAVGHMTITALTGPSRPITDALGYRYAWDPRLGQYAHISAVAVLAPDGRLVRWLAGPQVDPKELGAALEEARGGKPAPISERLLLLCYHLLAPGTGYDHQVVRALRIVGGVSVTLLLVLIGALVGRERLRGRL